MWWLVSVAFVSGSVAGYVQAVDRVLAAGQGLFPGGSSAPSGFGAGHSGVPAAPASSGLSDGVGAAAETYRGHWATVTGLDDGAGKASADGQDAGSSGHAGATGVRQSAQSSAQALAPTTKSPAGVTKLVSTMDDRLAAMQRQIDTTTTQNRVLSMRLRQLAAGFRGMGGAGGAMGSMMPGGMGGGGMPGGGMGSGGGGGIPGLSALAGLRNLGGAGRAQTAGMRGGPEPRGIVGTPLGSLTPNSSQREIAAAIIHEAHRRGYSRQQTEVILADGFCESNLNGRAKGGGGAWHGVFQQDTSYPGRDNPNLNIEEYFNRLGRHGGPGSPDIAKSIFWLQQRPGEPSAEAAYANGRKGYLGEMLRQLPRARDIYASIVAA